MGTTQRGQGRVVAMFFGLVLVAVAAGPMVLHFTQKRHNELHVALLEPRAQEEPTAPSGEVFAGTLAAIIEHELSGGSGWRPNDFFLWGRRLMADNNANRQLGIIQAVRESVRVFKDHLTKVSSTEYDSNLVAAETAFRNDAERFWFPSAESKLHDGLDGLRLYVDGLRAVPPRSKPVNRRNVELIRLFQVWTDLLGDAHANLFKTHETDGSAVPMWRTDDYFYHAQGFAHVMYYLIRAVKREYEVDLVNRPSVIEVFDEVTDALRRAAILKPLVVVDGSTDGLFANHRRNLDGYIVDARQKMYSIREELEK